MARTGPSIQIGDITIAPGESRTAHLELPTLYSHSPVHMPVHVINGRRDGPRLFVSAAMHGDELNGIEIIRRLLRARNIGKLKGALIAVPVINVYGFINQSRYLPDRRDLNRAFPGSASGSMAGRLANTFMEQLVTRCTHGVDLHTAAIGRDNLPQIRARVVDAEGTKEMAKAFGAPVILNSELRDGSLREACEGLGIPCLIYEAGEALRFDEVSIRAGVQGILNVMRLIGMLPKSRRKRPSEPFIAKSSAWVRAPMSGILRAIKPLASQVDKGDTIGWVADPFGELELPVVAPDAGIVIGKANMPLVHEGEALFHIARFQQLESATESIDAFVVEHEPDIEEIDPRNPPLV